MIYKNLEKLAEIGERKLFSDLNINLAEIKLSWNNEEALDKKIKSYKCLIANCKSCGLDVNEQEKRYVQIINDVKENKIKYLLELPIRTRYEYDSEREMFII